MFTGVRGRDVVTYSLSFKYMLLFLFLWCVCCCIFFLGNLSDIAKTQARRYAAHCPMCHMHFVCADGWCRGRDL